MSSKKRQLLSEPSTPPTPSSATTSSAPTPANPRTELPLPGSTGPSTSLSLDSVDIRILNLLQEDGRLSVRELARKVNLSVTPVHQRLRRLESSGIIDHYAAVINTGKIASFIVFFVNIVLKEHSTRLGGEFIRQITSFPEVVEFHVIGGEHDFMIKVIVPDMTAYRRFFVQQLGEVPNIAKLQSIIVLETIREDSRIPL